MPKRSMVAIFGPELECVLFVAAPPLSKIGIDSPQNFHLTLAQDELTPELQYSSARACDRA